MKNHLKHLEEVMKTMTFSEDDVIDILIFCFSRLKSSDQECLSKEDDDMEKQFHLWLETRK